MSTTSAMPPRWRRRSRLGVAMAGLGAASALALGALPAGAASAGSSGGIPLRLAAGGNTIFSETFANSTVSSSVTLPTAPTPPNTACITASNTVSGTPVPGCAAASPIDPSGQGALRLTFPTAQQEGGLFSSASVPTAEGLDVNFNSFQYNAAGSSPADGIVFALAAVDPQVPAAPAALGPTGGSLGYSSDESLVGNQGAQSAGLADGYLGIGLDVFGNFSSTLFQGTGCTDQAFQGLAPGEVVVRGPGNGQVGYCALNSSAVLAGAPTSYALNAASATTRTSATVPVEVAINPASTSTTTSSGVVVPASSYAVKFTEIGGTSFTMTGPLPSTLNGEIPAGLYPSSWINPTTGIPFQLAFGWTSSTGSFVEIHEINDATVATLSSVGAPVLTFGTIKEYATAASTNSTFETWDFPVGVAPGPAEADTIRANISLPAGSVVSSAGGGSTTSSTAAKGSRWTCTESGAHVACQTVGGPFSSKNPPPAIFVSATFPNPGGSRPSLRPRSAETAEITVTSMNGVPGHGRSNLSTKSPPKPTSMKLTPNAGSTAGGTTIVISGDNLAHTSSVAIGKSVAEACPGARNQPCFTEAGNVVTVDNSPPGLPRSAPVVVTTLGVFGQTSFGYLEGYWCVAGDGGVFGFGRSAYHGSLGGTSLSSPVIGMAPAPLEGGYWLVEANGTVKAFGSAPSLGSVPAKSLSGHIVGIASTPDGLGYWLASSTGVVYPFGDALHLGNEKSPAGTITAIVRTPSGAGYWLLSSKGDVYHFGSAGPYGNVSSPKGTAIGIATTPDGRGYWVVSTEGDVYHFGDAGNYGPAAGSKAPGAAVGIAAAPDGKGVWVAFGNGYLTVRAYGAAGNFKPPSTKRLNKPLVGISVT